MAAFNKSVLFKESEFLREMIKVKVAIRMKNMMLLNQDNEKSNEKGLLVAKLHLTKSMTVHFVNQAVSDIIGSENKEIVGLPVNNIMPQLISENHQRFVSEFMTKGKARILNDKRALYIKDKQGYVVPVYLYLQVNHFNRHYMMAIIEPNFDFQPFEDVSPLFQTPFLLTD